MRIRWIANPTYLRASVLGREYCHLLNSRSLASHPFRGLKRALAFLPDYV
jgi:hypothetical protein